jgi:hypothetical protein
MSSYTNVAVREEDGTLMLKRGTAQDGAGKLVVHGTLESGANLEVGIDYKIDGQPNLAVTLPYAGSPTSGVFEFKID